MWILNFEYKGIKFHILEDWTDELKLCLSMTDDLLERCIDPLDLVDGIRFVTAHREEIGYVGQSGVEGFWNMWEHDNTLDEQAHIAEIVSTSQFASEKCKERAKEQLAKIAEKKQATLEKQAKQFYSKRRRSQFMRDYDRLILSLIERDGYRCAECGTVEDLTIDHIMPLSRGGTDELDNLQLLCRRRRPDWTCNG